MQRDSTAMKTISVLGLVFLPGTFISVRKVVLVPFDILRMRLADRNYLFHKSIFGMTFFAFTPKSSGWSTSSQFWIYWVVTIPVTLATWVIWRFLTRREMP